MREPSVDVTRSACWACRPAVERFFADDQLAPAFVDVAERRRLVESSQVMVTT